MLEVIDVVKSVSGVDFPVKLSPRRAGDPSRIIAGADRIRALAHRLLAFSRPGREEMAKRLEDGRIVFVGRESDYAREFSDRKSVV